MQKTLYLHADGKLSFEAPAQKEATTYDEYLSDPARPVPFMDDIVPGMPEQYMVGDQRYASRRTDVLVYVTEPLEADVTMVGPVSPNLWVSTSGTDSDYIVKVIDVYPDRYADEKGDVNNKMGGFQQMVRGDSIRGKFRNSFEKPEPFSPNKPAAVNFTTSDIHHTFQRGHRIMVQIHSSWFPVSDINPQRFMDISKATSADFQKATERIYHTIDMPSQVKVGLLPTPSVDIRR
jgi:uncharacterized protein